MKTTSIAIDKVFKLLKAGLSIPVYKLTKPTAKDLKEYIIINSLPISSDVMQSCVVNVNYHTKDLGAGIPDNELLDTTEPVIIGILDMYSENGTIDILIDFLSQETIRNEAQNEHYSNLRFSVKIINK